MEVWTPLAGVGMLAVAAGAVLYWLWRGPAGVRGMVAPFAWGALAWLLGGLVLKVPLGLALERWEEGGRPPAAGVRWGALGLMTGVTEVGVAAGLAWVPGPRGHAGDAALASSRAAYWRAVAFGVGFGAAEAALLAVDPLLSPLEALGPGAGGAMARTLVRAGRRGGRGRGKF